MGRIVVTESVSLDGVMEDPGGAEGFRHGGWTFQFDQGDDGRRFKLDELFNSEALLLGRVTYQGFAQAWPSISDPVGFADRMNSIRKYVVSSTLTDAEADCPEKWRESSLKLLCQVLMPPVDNFVGWQLVGG